MGKAEELLPDARAANGDEARRALVDAWLAVGNISAAIGAAADLSRDTDKVKALLSISEYGRETAIPADASVDQAIGGVESRP